MVGFSLPVFFVLFRECTEAGIVISVMLSFVNKFFQADLEMKRVLCRAMWLGSITGLLVSMSIGAVFLVLWFKYASNLWASTEVLWEAVFQLIACILLSVMAFAFAKSDKLTAKWHKKLEKLFSEHSSRFTQSSGSTQAFFWIPFVTILREGLEGMIFLGGTAASDSPGNIPFAVLAGLACGALVGLAIYRAGNSMKMRSFFVGATILIFYLSAGLLSKAVRLFELNAWNQVLGVSGEADLNEYYNVQSSVWHLDCCNPDDSSEGGWQMFSAIFGWTNSATIGSIVSYIFYWLFVSISLMAVKVRDRQRVRRDGKVEQ
ncbi:iron permease FTR1/Fip1/EfeU [Obelidium mucronatum]|nr:iron permease FTR1/Fip1/EfeU [Obelidium mucronatum]